jgi:hypothetical protein
VDTSSTPTSPETGSLDLNQASEAFNALLDPPKEDETKAGAQEAEQEPPAESNAQEEGGDDATQESDAADDETVTVLVDGKPVELTKAQIAEAHKSGLRQADYTKKTTELAEQRKTAEAETAKARDERNQYMQGLQKAQAVLESQLQEQQKIDWAALIDSDPVEALRQQHLQSKRQAEWQQMAHQRQQLEAMAHAEHAEALKAHVESEREKLIANIPEWKDEAKRKAGATELREYLKTQGLSEQEIYSVTDHRAITQSYKAMKYDQMMVKASAAAKKIQSTPERVLRPSGGESPQLDRRSAAYQRLAKTGSVQAAADVFTSLIS